MLTDHSYGLPRPRPLALPPAGTLYLDAVLASTVFDLDATIAASYPGSGQTWANLTAAPADGSAQAAYDFYRGGTAAAHTDDPTFNGTPGDPAAYWSVDGADFWRLAGAKTAFLNALHKTTDGSNFWLALALRWVTSANGLFGTANASSSTGMNLRSNTNGAFTFRQYGSAQVAYTSATGLLVNGEDSLLILSYDHASHTLAHWVDTRTATTTTMNFNTTTADAAGAGEIFTRGDGSFCMSAGARLYGCAMGHEYLDNTKAGLIIDHLNARHGRTYA
ncbi:MAG: hypothetical protein NDJ24_01635 [Alphaproteobacteria bacterium]|nr:hypothetical protein [Alphaproteobacteria bacterium]